MVLCLSSNIDGLSAMNDSSRWKKSTTIEMWRMMMKIATMLFLFDVSNNNNNGIYISFFSLLSIARSPLAFVSLFPTLQHSPGINSKKKQILPFVFNTHLRINDTNEHVLSLYLSIYTLNISLIEFDQMQCIICTDI